MSGHRNGIALIIVVGVLSVLAVVATAFVMMAELERRASSQRMLSVKAYLLARSGLEDALARLAAGQDTGDLWNSYQGEDHNVDLVLGGLEIPAEIYRPAVLDKDDCPLRHALRPTYYVADFTSVAVPKLPALQRVDGRDRGYSGILGENRFTYALKAASPDGFYVNGGDPAQPAGVGFNGALRRILGTLAEAIDQADGANDSSPVNQTDGEALVNTRPPSGWSSFNQLRSVALGGSQAKWEALKPYLTITAWVDKRVIAPNPPASAMGKKYEAWGEYTLDHKLNPSVANSRAPGFEYGRGEDLNDNGLLNPGEDANGNGLLDRPVVGRAPVYLGWARAKRPALIALLAGLRGVYVNEWRATPHYDGDIAAYNDRFGTLTSAEVINTWSPADDCHVAADAILAAGALDTWSQWNAFCDTIAFTGTSDQPQAKRDILKANFNPNSDLNKFGPNPSMWKLVDKSDLLVYSTEFSLFPVQGTEVQSVGRVLDRQGRLLAFRTLKATLSGPSVARISTQREFACDNLGNLDSPGDETGFRVPGDSPFVSLSQGIGGTWGHARLPLQVAGGRGVALQLYPEPYVATGGDGTVLSINAANYDGNLQLATVETQNTDYYGVTAAMRPTRDIKALARFDDGFDLDVSDARDVSGIADGAVNQTETSQVSTAELSNSLWHATKPNTLYPDGAYSEKRHAPAFYDKGNTHGYHALFSLWVKHNFYTRDLTDPDIFRSRRGRMYFDWYSDTVDVLSLDSEDQYYSVGYAYTETIDPQKYRLNMFFEISHEWSDVNREHCFAVADGDILAALKNPVPHQWWLVTWHWDAWNPEEDECARILQDTGTAAVELGTIDLYDSNKSNNAKAATDITDPNPVDLSRHKMFLGRPWPGGWLQGCGDFGGGADSTLDDFAIYDFGGSGPGGVPALNAGAMPATVASTRYKDGRYYKDALYYAPGATGAGQAGSWISAPISLPSGCTLQKVAWTWHRPPGLADDYPEIEFLNVAGNAYAWPSGSQSGRRDAQSWGMSKVVSSDFRIRVNFTRDGAVPADPDGVLPANTPILDSPVFDDLSLVYLPSSSGAPRYLSWVEGGE